MILDSLRSWKVSGLRNGLGAGERCQSLSVQSWSRLTASIDFESSSHGCKDRCNWNPFFLDYAHTDYEKHRRNVDSIDVLLREGCVTIVSSALRIN